MPTCSNLLTSAHILGCDRDLLAWRPVLVHRGDLGDLFIDRVGFGAREVATFRRWSVARHVMVDVDILERCRRADWVIRLGHGPFPSPVMLASRSGELRFCAALLGDGESHRAE